MIDYTAVLEQYQTPVPRYTSYPTAPQFEAGRGGELFHKCISKLKPAKPISAYIHIPYCDRLCWFCGCHTKHTLKYEPIARYVKTLVSEIELFAKHAPFRPKLGQLHLGGGSPSLLKLNDLQNLKQALKSAFEFDAQTEISVEIDPSDVSPETIDGLMQFGLTRASIGVQDFDDEVQAAINRPQTFETTREVVNALRSAGVSSINIDALYGLPLQTNNRLLKTIEQCVDLQPDRVALFGYAHVPWLKKHQNLIRTEDLPNPVERFEHAAAASVALVNAGYTAIGIDHFSMPEDSLAKAAEMGTLRRNFQGYTTDNHETLIGFGSSSIGRFSEGYVQNTVATGQYQMEVKSGVFPKAKGLTLTADDHLRADIIERLMCDLEIDFNTLTSHPERLVDICFNEAKAFATEDRFGLCDLNDGVLTIPPSARPLARVIAAQFDAYYRHGEFQYSKAV